MNLRKQFYTVANHTFCIAMPQDYALWQFLNGFQVFAESDPCEATCFDLSIVPEVACPDAKAICIEQSNQDEVSAMDVYATDSQYLLAFHSASNELPDGKMLCSKDFKSGQLAFYSDNIRICYSIFVRATMMMFALSVADKATLLIHASAAVYDGKAYLFHAASGTGKSTHNRLWQQHIPGAEMLNDDHPILRISDDGEIIAYGSPWSGKTPCYRNLSYPLGAMVRITRADQNAIAKLPLIQSYASFVPSCAKMNWDSTTMNHIQKTIERVVTSIPCYRLGCLPDEGAARLCWTTVIGKETK